MDVAHVVIRLGETTIEDACVRGGEQFWIGSHAGAHLAVAGIGAFPLVTGEGGDFTVRTPIGTTLAVDGRAIDATELRLAPHTVVTLALGLAAIEIELSPLPHMPVPRPPPDARPAAYTAISLLAHLALWGAAIELAPDEVYITGRPRLVTIGLRHAFDRGVPSTAPARDANVDPATTEDVGRTTAEHLAAPSTPHPVDPVLVASDHARPKASERAEPIATLTGFDDLATAFDHIDIAGPLDQVGPLYRPDEAPGFGKTRQFDPTHRADYQSIESGRFQTIAHGEHAGGGYDLGRDMKLSLEPGGSVADPLVAQAIRDALEHVPTMTAECNISTGSVVRRVTIGTNGRPTQIEDLDGSTYDDCASRILASIEFPATGRETIAMISIERL